MFLPFRQCESSVWARGLSSSLVKRQGFTLIELLVVVAIIGAVSSVGFVGYRAALNKAEQTQCLSNMRQIGIAAVSYAQDHNGRFPSSSHSLDATNQNLGWIYTLEPYFAEVDEVRICPADPKGEQRLAANGTSYILNSFLTEEVTDPFGAPVAGGYTRMNQVPDPAQTPLAFVVSFASGVGGTNDHTHSESWTNWGAVLADIQPDAFLSGDQDAGRTKGSSNYLFVDGHAENIRSATVNQWITSGYNFSDPAGRKP